LPGDPDDTHSRYIEAAVQGVLIGCLYLPNGNPAPGPKFDYKLRWFARLIERAKVLLEHKVPVVLTGDHNAITDDDLDRLAFGWEGPIVQFASQAFGRGTALHVQAGRHHATAFVAARLTDGPYPGGPLSCGVHARRQRDCVDEIRRRRCSSHGSLSRGVGQATFALTLSQIVSGDSRFCC